MRKAITQRRTNCRARCFRETGLRNDLNSGSASCMISTGGSFFSGWRMVRFLTTILPKSAERRKPPFEPTHVEKAQLQNTEGGARGAVIGDLQHPRPVDVAPKRRDETFQTTAFRLEVADVIRRTIPVGYGVGGVGIEDVPGGIVVEDRPDGDSWGSRGTRGETKLPDGVAARKALAGVGLAGGIDLVLHQRDLVAVGSEESEIQIGNARLVDQVHRDGEVIDRTRVGNTDRVVVRAEAGRRGSRCGPGGAGLDVPRGTVEPVRITGLDEARVENVVRR